MKVDQYGQIIFNDQDLISLLMEGHNLNEISGILVDSTVQLDRVRSCLDSVPDLIAYAAPACTIEEFDHAQQSQWHMPDHYQTLDVAEFVLNKCTTSEQLQRCGQELILYQERDLMNLLRYLVYLVDTMNHHGLIWGVGRGSSVASYVLYLIGVHRIDSLYYNLDIEEFLR